MNGFFEAELVLFRNKTDVMGLVKDQPSFFLVTPQRATLFEEPTIFLEEKFVQNGGTPSPNTWAAAADALKSWFQFLQASKKEWHQASRQDRKDYRDAYLMAISPRTGQPFEPSTVAARMRVIRTFYLYATRRSWYAGDIGSSSDDTEVEVRVPIDRDPMAHIHNGRLTRRIDEDLPKSRPNIVIRPLQLRDLQKLLSYIGPQAARRNGDMRQSRDRLFIDLGWAVGLRVSEIQSLSTLQFLCIHPDESAPLVSYPLVVTGKGRKRRSVAIPGWLVEDAIAYILGERVEALKAGRVSSRSASTALFLGEASSSRPGKPISTRRLQQILEHACLDIGLTTAVSVVDPDTKKSITKFVQRYSVHDLRHTYAVLTYHAELSSGNTEPWKRIQAQLGHEHMITTIDTYLNHVEIFGDKQLYYDIRQLIGIQ